MTEAAAATPGGPEGPGLAKRPALRPGEVTDAFLLAATAPEVTAARLERVTSRWVLTVHRDGRSQRVGAVPRSVGDQVVDRLSSLVGLCCPTRGEALGKLHATLPSGDVRLLVSLGPGRAELRRLDGSFGPPLFMLPRSETPTRIGPYVVVDVIGRGGMGVVYRAVHEWLGTHVAVKILEPGAELAAVRTVLFAREAWAASRASHPGVVRILDAGLADDRAYLVMELVEEPTLRRRLRDAPMAAGDVAALGIALCSAVDAIHRAGLLHCDIKPENVFVDDELHVKVGDFGAARLVGADLGAASAEPLFATPEYLAPEILAGARPTRASDVYAIGCVLWEALEGDTPRPRRLGRGGIVAEGGGPGALRHVLGRALAAQAYERYGSASCMGDALAELRLARSPSVGPRNG